MKIELELKDIDIIKNLLELIESHYEDLPTELKKQLHIISEEGFNDITSDTLDKMLISGNRVIKTNIYTDKIVSVNKVLRKVLIMEDGVIKPIYPVNFYLIVNDIKIVEWEGNIK